MSRRGEPHRVRPAVDLGHAAGEYHPRFLRLAAEPAVELLQYLPGAYLAVAQQLVLGHYVDGVQRRLDPVSRGIGKEQPYTAGAVLVQVVNVSSHRVERLVQQGVVHLGGPHPFRHQPVQEGAGEVQILRDYTLPFGHPGNCLVQGPAALQGGLLYGALLVRQVFFHLHLGVYEVPYHQLVLHAGQQFLGAEGLHDVIVAAETEPLHHVVQPGTRRHHDDGDVTLGHLFTHLPCHLVPAHPRQHDVQHHQVGSFLSDHCQRRRPVHGGLHTVSPAGKYVARDPQVHHVVVHHQQVPRPGRRSRLYRLQFFKNGLRRWFRRLTYRHPQSFRHRRHRRQPHREYAPRAVFALHPDVAAVQPGQVFRYRQPQARPPVLP